MQYARRDRWFRKANRLRPQSVVVGFYCPIHSLHFLLPDCSCVRQIWHAVVGRHHPGACICQSIPSKKLIYHPRILMGDPQGLGIAHWAVLLVAVAGGLGADLAMISQAKTEYSVATVHPSGLMCKGRIFADCVSQLALEARILLLVCHYVGKISTVTFTRRVFSGNLNRERLLFAISVVVPVFCGLVSVLITSVNCRSLYILSSKEQSLCSGGVR